MDMNNMISSLAGRVPTDTNTYEGADGLLYCKNCGTARQVRVSFLGDERVVPCICRCMEAAREKEKEARERYERALEIERFRKMGFPDREFEKCTFSVDDGLSPKITNAMKSYVENFKYFRKEGKGLLLYGNVGTGKSFHAACVVNELIDRGYPCLMTNFSRLTNQINGMWDGKQDYIDSLGRFALVAIDDLGVERDTEFMNESVTTIIDSLYRSKVPMIITSNYTPKQLTEDCEIRRKRVYDRLLERCHPIKVDGESRRKQKGRNDFADMNKMLGL